MNNKNLTKTVLRQDNNTCRHNSKIEDKKIPNKVLNGHYYYYNDCKIVFFYNKIVHFMMYCKK